MKAPTSHKKAKALKPGSRRPAKELCSECGLCDTYYIHYVKEACAFLNQQVKELELQAHGRSRNLDREDDLYFGVHQDMMAARKKEPIPGAQWTGIVSTIACEMLNQGLVEGVVCVQNTKEDRFGPMPVIARTPEEVLAARVNKPTLSPNLSILEQVEQSGMKRLLAIGVGCQIQALRAVQQQLGLEKLYVLGTPCVDNVTRAGLQKFLETTSKSPDTVVHYEFMQDFRVHFKHEDGSIEKVPFFGLKTNQLKDVFCSFLHELLRLCQLFGRFGGGLHGRYFWLAMDRGAQRYGKGNAGVSEASTEYPTCYLEGRSRFCGTAEHSCLR